jgi:hypothetical protein
MVTESAIADELLTNPDQYDVYRNRYQSEREYYRQVRNKAPQSLSTFGEFLELHAIFLNRSASDQIKEWVEENLARSLKNMVLGTSPRGRAYPLTTLADIQARLEDYRSIGIDTPELKFVVDTIIEALFDTTEDGLRSDAHETLVGLLKETPPGTQVGGPTDILAQLKSVHSLASDRLAQRASSPADQLALAAKEYRAAMPCPSAPTGADACVAAAKGIPPGNVEKRKLLAAAVHQDPSQLEAFWELLYWSARATIERFRHRTEHPTLGRLYRAQYQLVIVDSHRAVVGKSDHWQHRIDAYRHVATGIECGQGRYTTTRENWPETAFSEAASAYERAAEAIEPVDTARQLKYQSKAYRYQAHAAPTPERTYEIHGDAIEWLLSTTDDEESEHLSLVQDLLRHHRFYRLTYEIKRAFVAHEFASVIQLYADYHTLRQAVPVVAQSDTVVDACYHLAQAVRTWRQEETDSAVYHYQRVLGMELPASSISTETLIAHALRPQFVRASRAASEMAAVVPN